MKVDVCVKWSAVSSDDELLVGLAGLYQTIDISSSSGDECFTFTVPADNSSGRVWALLWGECECRDESQYQLPPSCQETPDCDLNIQSVSVSNCYYNDDQSKADVEVCVSWDHAPENDNIKVTIGSQEEIIYVNTTSGSKCVSFEMVANGTSGTVFAKFWETPECSDQKSYNLPQACDPTPECELEIKSVTVGECEYYSSSDQSRADVEVCVKWDNAPANDNIMVNVGGQQQVIYVNSTSGTQCVTFTMVANGLQGTVTAKFWETPECSDEEYYSLPEACIPDDDCMITITDVQVGDCYYDAASGKSKASLMVCVDWKNAPSNEKVIVALANQIVPIWVDRSTGSGCAYFTLWLNDETPSQELEKARFELTRDCNDEAYFTEPAACAPYGDRLSDDEQEAESRNLVSDRLEAVQPAQIKVFPNPTQHEVFVDLSAFAGKTAQVQILNTVGQLVHETQIDEVNTDRTRFDVSNLPSDMYLIRVQIESEGMFTEKFVIRK